MWTDHFDTILQVAKYHTSICQRFNWHITSSRSRRPKVKPHQLILLGTVIILFWTYFIAQIIPVMMYRSMHKWTRKWSEFISTKRHLFRLGFHEVIILVYKNLDHGWSGRWLVDDLVRVHLGKFIPSFFIRKIVQMNSDQIINQSATRSTMVQVLIDQNYPCIKTHAIWLEIYQFLSIWTRTNFEFI